jgi:hypothetical protein
MFTVTNQAKRICYICFSDFSVERRTEAMIEELNEMKAKQREFTWTRASESDIRSATSSRRKTSG